MRAQPCGASRGSAAAAVPAPPPIARACSSLIQAACAAAGSTTSCQGAAGTAWWSHLLQQVTPAQLHLLCKYSIVSSPPGACYFPLLYQHTRGNGCSNASCPTKCPDARRPGLLLAQPFALAPLAGFGPLCSIATLQLLHYVEHHSPAPMCPCHAAPRLSYFTYSQAVSFKYHAYTLLHQDHVTPFRLTPPAPFHRSDTDMYH